MSGLRDAHLKDGSKNVCPRTQLLSAEIISEERSAIKRTISCDRGSFLEEAAFSSGNN